MARAFTLIQLLVVVAVIATLAAILFPVFAQSKNGAKQTVDLSNLSQIGLSAIIYCSDFDDLFPRNDYLGVERQRSNPITFREQLAPYARNGVNQRKYVMLNGSTGPLADTGISVSPTQPPGLYGYGANQALFQSGQQMRDPAHCVVNDSKVVFNDQNCDGELVPGGTAAASMALTGLLSPATTLMITTIGINSTKKAGNVYMHSSLYWWEGCVAKIRGATIPPNNVPRRSFRGLFTAASSFLADTSFRM